jgi:hypothetical protein
LLKRKKNAIGVIVAAFMADLEDWKYWFDLKNQSCASILDLWTQVAPEGRCALARGLCQVWNASKLPFQAR